MTKVAHGGYSGHPNLYSLNERRKTPTSHPWLKLKKTEKIAQGSEGIPVSKSK